MPLKGIPVSPGYAIGRAYLYRASTAVQASNGTNRVQGSPEEEGSRLLAAIETAKRELESIVSDVEHRVGAAEAGIFRSHLALLRDPEIVGASLRATGAGTDAEKAFGDTIEENAAIFEGMEDDPLLKERASDLRDVGKRVQSLLAGRPQAVREELPPGSVLVIDELQPSDITTFDTGNIVALAVGRGGPTSHSAILAKAMGLVAVFGIGDLSAINEGAELVVDGFSGEIILAPSADVKAGFLERRAAFLAERDRLATLAREDTFTRSGKRIIVAANIGSLDELDACLKQGAEGIGLFRTEFLFMRRDQAPTEEEQFHIYKSVLERMAPKPVVIRTLDIGGDKEVPYLGLSKEANPFLGLRAIRLCLRDIPLFKSQLRALLRASHYGKLGIMFPMISSVEELRRAKVVLDDCAAELRAEKAPPEGDYKVGIMIEIPSAALVADDLAAECDFFSIGTNDLTQYTLAVDRLNESVAQLYSPRHPAVLRLIKMAIEAAHRRGISCAMCGELAGDSSMIPTLLSYGLDEFSMSASSIPAAKDVLSHCQ